jgi:hypothetical protein
MNTDEDRSVSGELRNVARLCAAFLERVIMFRGIVLKVPAGVVRQSHCWCISALHRKWARRWWWWFRPIRSPVVILRRRLRSHFLNLVWAKSGVPDNLPSHGQSLQMDKAVTAVWLGVPSVIADAYLRSFRFSDALGVSGQRVDQVDGSVSFPKLGESLFVSAPSPAIEEKDQRCANQQCQCTCNQCRPLAVPWTDRLPRRSSECNYERDRQQLDEGPGLSEGAAAPRGCGKCEHA